MLVPHVHAGRADRLDLLLGKLGRGKATAALPKAPEFLVLIRPDKIARDLTVTRDGNGLSLSTHSIATEIPRELRGGYGLWCVHWTLLVPINICKLREIRKSRFLIPLLDQCRNTLTPALSHGVAQGHRGRG